MKKPRSYYCHKSNFLPNTLPIAQNLEIVQKIGEGAFGEVFKVFDHNSSELKVIKRHKRQSSRTLIDKENQVMKEMSGSDGFAKIKDFFSEKTTTRRDYDFGNTVRSAQVDFKKPVQGQKTNNQESIEDEFIVMECLGQNLGKIVEKKPLSIFSMKRIAEQLILRLKELHDKNYVHRDLKPENILLGNQVNPHKIYLVDFGLVSSYRKEIKKVRKMYDGVIGTAKFCPLASHYGNEQFPKDDLESLGYVLIFLIKGVLPWKFQQEMTEEQRFEKMQLMKESLSISTLTEGVACLKNFFKYVQGLQPNSPIDYGFIRNLFKTESQEEYCYEFCKENCFYKLKRLGQGPSIEQKQPQHEKLKMDSEKIIPIETYRFQSKFIKEKKSQLIPSP